MPPARALAAQGTLDREEGAAVVRGGSYRVAPSLGVAVPAEI